MSGQRRSTGEGLLAVGVWAFVRPFAGMDAAVSRQRARVTERLIRPPPASQIHSIRTSLRPDVPCYNAHTYEVFHRYELGRVRSRQIAE